jgi:hypothetical protein
MLLAHAGIRLEKLTEFHGIIAKEINNAKTFLNLA